MHIRHTSHDQSLAQQHFDRYEKDPRIDKQKLRAKKTSAHVFWTIWTYPCPDHCQLTLGMGLVIASKIWRGCSEGFPQMVMYVYFHLYIYNVYIYYIYTQYLDVYTMIRHVHQDSPGSCVAMMFFCQTEARPATSTDVVVLSPGKPRGF